MKNTIAILAAAVILSIAIVFSAVYLGNAMIDSERADEAVSEAAESLLLTEDKAAELLGLTPETFRSVIKRQNIERQNLTSYATYRFIPYIEIDGTKYYSPIELEKWIEYNMLNK